MLGLTPIFGTRLGLPVPFIVWLLSAVQFGSFVCLWPIGRLSDRVDRRWVIAGCAMAVSLLSPVIAWPGPTGTGCCRSSSSTVPAALPSMPWRSPTPATFAEPDQMVGVSGGSLLVWAAGAAIGPTVAAPFIDRARATRPVRLHVFDRDSALACSCCGG